MSQGIKMDTIILYHGSPNKIVTPVFGGGDDKHDYGRGFYLTENIDLAKEWAVCRPNEQNGWVHKYELNTRNLKILDFQEKDDRYRYCLDRLAKMQDRSMIYEIIERRELTKVHEFDYFYEDFRKVISHIYETMDDSDTLLLNVSSGTPAMKSGLLVLQTLGEFPAKVIQVATPVGKLNEQIHEGYDVETLWGLDEDNLEGAQNRCKEIQCPTLSKIKKRKL